MSLQKLKIERAALVDAAREIKIHFPEVKLNLVRANKKIVVLGERLDYFTGREIELLIKKYFPEHQIQIQARRRLNYSTNF